jgi:uncharacterized protein YndB with AHSA1/START domain
VTTREVRTSVIVDATRQEIWELLTTPTGLTSCVAPGAQVHAVEGGQWRLAFDAAGKRPFDGGTILKFARDQELVIGFEAPEALTSLGRAPTRLIWAIEPLASALQRLVLIHTDIGNGGEWDRLFDHLQSAWPTVLERIRRRTVLYAPTISTYEPFWAGL